MSEPYRPSNGAEGELFRRDWCDRCARDCEDNPCQILAATFWLAVDDPDYPPEWIEDDAGPRCTVFAPLLEDWMRTPTIPDPRQLDMLA